MSKPITNRPNEHSKHKPQASSSSVSNNEPREQTSGEDSLLEGECLDNFHPKEWDINTFEPRQTGLFIGKRHTGKTVGIINLLFNLCKVQKEIDGAAVISASEKANNFFQEFIPKQYVHPFYNPQVLKAMFDLQAYHKACFEEGMINKMPELLAVLDDLAADPRLIYDEMINSVYMLGRHYGMTCLMTTQYPKSVSPKVRSNADFVFIFKVLSRDQYDFFYSQFGGHLDRKTFYRVLDEATDGFSCLVINQKVNSTNAEEVFFKYTFQFPLPKFKVGTKQEWETAKKLEQEERKATIENNKNAKDQMVAMNINTLLRGKDSWGVIKSKFNL